MRKVISINELEVGKTYCHDDIWALSDIFALSETPNIAIIRTGHTAAELMKHGSKDVYTVLAIYHSK